MANFNYPADLYCGGRVLYSVQLVFNYGNVELYEVSCGRIIQRFAYDSIRLFVDSRTASLFRITCLGRAFIFASAFRDQIVRAACLLGAALNTDALLLQDIKFESELKAPILLEGAQRVAVFGQQQIIVIDDLGRMRFCIGYDRIQEAETDGKAIRLQLVNGEAIVFDLVEFALATQLHCCLECRRFLMAREKETKVLAELSGAEHSSSASHAGEAPEVEAAPVQQAQKQFITSSDQVSTNSELSFHGSEAPRTKLQLPSAIKSPALKKVQGIKFLANSDSIKSEFESGNPLKQSMTHSALDGVLDSLEPHNQAPALLKPSPPQKTSRTDFASILSPSSRLTREQFAVMLQKMPRSTSAELPTPQIAAPLQSAPSTHSQQIQVDMASSQRSLSGSKKLAQQATPRAASPISQDGKERNSIQQSARELTKSIQSSPDAPAPVSPKMQQNPQPVQQPEPPKSAPTPNLNFAQIIERLQTPFVAYKYMVGRKKFHEVKVFLPIEAAPNFVPLCWCKPSVQLDHAMGVSIRDWSEKNYIDVVACANNAGQLPFGRDVEKALRKLPFDCENEHVFVLYSKRRPWVCVVLAMELSSGFAQAMKVVTQTIQQQQQNANADDSINRSIHAMSLSSRPSRRPPSHQASGIDEFDGFSATGSVGGSESVSDAAIRSRGSRAVSSKRLEKSAKNDFEDEEKDFLGETGGEKKKKTREEKRQEKELLRQQALVQKERQKAEKEERKIQERELKEQRALEKEQARLRGASSATQSAAERENQSARESGAEGEGEEYQYVYEEEDE